MHAAGAAHGRGHARAHRERVLSAAAALVPQVPVRRVLRALGACPATWYRRQKPPLARARPRSTPPLALLAAERIAILELLNSARFADVTPYTAYARLLDE